MKRFDVTTEAAGQGDYFGAMEESSDGEWIKYEEAEAAIAAAVAAEREACAVAALGAKLPAHFRWGHDAMEQFDFGKERAARAIRARKEPTA